MPSEFSVIWRQRRSAGGRRVLNADPYRLGAVPPTGNPPLGYPDPALCGGDGGGENRSNFFSISG
jgi:hypothetical protein